MVGSHSGALHIRDNHAEGSRDSEFEVINGEVVGPEIRTVGIEKLDLEEDEGEPELADAVGNGALFAAPPDQHVEL